MLQRYSNESLRQQPTAELENTQATVEQCTVHFVACFGQLSQQCYLQSCHLPYLGLLGVGKCCSLSFARSRSFKFIRNYTAEQCVCKVFLVTRCFLCVYLVPLTACSASNVGVTLKCWLGQFKVIEYSADRQIIYDLLLVCLCILMQLFN